MNLIVKQIICFSLICLTGCNFKKQTKPTFNSKDLRCAITEEKSKLWNKRTRLEPNGRDFEESKTVWEELNKRLDDTNVRIAKKAHRLANEIIIFYPVDESKLNKTSCILREIMEEYDTKPISISIQERREVKNEKTGIMEKRRFDVKGYVVE